MGLEWIRARLGLVIVIVKEFGGVKLRISVSGWC